MNKTILRSGCWLLLFMLLFSREGSGQGYLKADGKRIVNERGENVLLRGMGLGGWMLQEPYMLQVSGVAGTQGEIRRKVEELVGPVKTQQFYNAWLANHTREIDIDSMAAWGFNSVRLAMHYNLYTLPVEEEPVKGQQTWHEKGFAMTDSLLAWCKANNMYLFLDLHAAPGGQGNDNAIADRDPNKPSLWDSRENQEKIIALWRKLAERYANEPWIGGYDLINEPNWGFQNATDKNGCNEKENAPLLQLQKAITKAIREVDKNHIVIIEGNCWGNNYAGMMPPWDSNMVLSFHKYWNYNDQASIQNMLAMREQYNVPVWLGETGENSNLWFRDAIALLERNNIGWAWWPLKKLGFNNPLEVKVNAGYQHILDYWRGKGAKPDQDKAFSALMQLAEDTKLENCIYHKDVVDAMFRQVKSDEVKPFRNHLVKGKATTTVYAVDYDLGRNGRAYFDKDTANYHVATGGERTAWNHGRTYRNDGVDIMLIHDDVNNGYGVGWTEEGEWLQYTISVQKAGKYTVGLRVASEKEGQVLLQANASTVPGSITVPNTGSSTAWQTIHKRNVRLKKGANTLRIKVEKGGFNLNYIQLSKS
ncbi:cellulase family glycosylhydrolase [Pontibacter ruber]|uniref:Cellulase family glycosylhydrolase n=1 Tax=Pontibacter ruber TaxID=1343895 RepID=A0ABW5CW63_9BACT|nr:cellulase family glycosylhydrolase [Pontibacter ruber]